MFLCERTGPERSRWQDGSRVGIFLDNHLNIVKYLVGRGAIVDSVNDDGETALIAASGGDHLDTLRFLCESGADVNAAINDGWTALMEASDQGHLAVVRYLT